MKIGFISCVLFSLLLGLGCKNKNTVSEKKDGVEDFPPAMVNFSPISSNPVFQGTAQGKWDKDLRERGYILYENGTYKLWYTGYNDSITKYRYVGLATSKDGITWKKYREGPIIPDVWTEDIQVVKHEGLYYMFSEGENDIAHMLTSSDGISWEPKGKLNIHKVNGEPISDGPYGTPTVWVENGKKYLFYERNDLGIWVATSEDFINWTNLRDDPVLEMGPDDNDSGAIAANQIVKYNGSYYMFYHGSSNPDWMDPNVVALWTSNVAMSKDLLHWTKYPDNPIVEGDHSSPILVFDGKRHYLYTTHDKIWRYNPK